MNRTAAYRPFAGGYVSEFEQFMDGYMATHPAVEKDRMRGCYIWWDQRVDLDELVKHHADDVPVKHYQYE